MTTLATLLAATVVVFVVLELLPGDPASVILGTGAREDTLAALREARGRDWLEHHLLIGPAYHHHATSLPIGFADVLVALGFVGLLALAVTGYLRQFPELLQNDAGGDR